MSRIVPGLVAAWLATGQRRYADAAQRHLDAWFVDPARRMNPSLPYAQAIIGVNTGRGIGIIDTLHLVETARAVMVLGEPGRQRFRLRNEAAIKGWFSDYLGWLTSSANGRAERDEVNNHGSAWVLQAAQFAVLTGDEKTADWCRYRYKSALLPNQIAPDGSQPLELVRTKPYAYCLFNLDVLGTTAHLLSRPGDNLWQFTTPDGRSLARALNFMAPFIADKSRWPYPADVEAFAGYPVRHPALLFGGLALKAPALLKIWRGLHPDPQLPEVIRNFPIRQPLLWTS